MTYGTFATGENGHEFGASGQVGEDLAAMAAAGINAVRTYTVPPAWLLDLARHHGIWVLVGLPWEQHVAFLDDRGRARSIEQRVRDGVRACAGHPAVLGYAIGNEIPAAIVRWHGRRRVERFLRRLCRAAKVEDPEALVTYVNFPSTEYLQLDFLDFVAFNVYLEAPEALEGYVARLQSIAKERPLLMSEVGFDSRRNGKARQAEVLQWQVATAFRGGAAGTFVFAWTDEWHRGGDAIDDWDFGLTERDRRPKPALEAVRRAYSSVPHGAPEKTLRVSVVVCTHNGAATLDDCLRGLARLHYPDREVIVVDDGSTDTSADIAAAHDVRLIRTENQGLSAARNVGLAEATGEIVAYTDDDTVADPDWLGYLAATLLTSDAAGVGGPNHSYPGAGEVAACVANAPGGPVHVLLSDRVAEHLPGCNMAFRREWLEAIGGFDPQFEVAGDDVDVCWRLQERDGILAFHPAATVWHRRRSTVRGFWRQQRGYGRAEALLERKWPEKYNVMGHVSWSGRLYGRGLVGGLQRSRVYYGVWGSAAFQQRFDRAPGLWALVGLPEWLLVVLGLAAGSALGALWTPLLIATPLLALAVALFACEAVLGAARADFRSLAVPRRGNLRRRLLTGLLYVVQPAARLTGRLGEGLAPWRRPHLQGVTLPRRLTEVSWFEGWRAPEERLALVEYELRAAGARVSRGGEFARWDLQVDGGALGGLRARTVVEEHGRGRQQLLTRTWPRVRRPVATGTALVAVLAALAALDAAWVVAGALGGLCAALLAGALLESGRAAVTLRRALAGAGRDDAVVHPLPVRAPAPVEPRRPAAIEPARVVPASRGTPG